MGDVAVVGAELAGEARVILHAETDDVGGVAGDAAAGSREGAEGGERGGCWGVGGRGGHFFEFLVHAEADAGVDGGSCEGGGELV